MFRFARTACRLAVGAARLPFAVIRGRKACEHKLISVDVFGTLLARFDDHAAWREGALKAYEVARSKGLLPSRDPLELRRAVERRISESLVSSGLDPEFSHQQGLEEMLRELGLGDAASAIADELAGWELETEIANVRPVAAVAESIRKWVDAGKPVVAVSDTRYTARELELLLSRQGISGLRAVYASADHSASKFSGRLFDLVAEHEGMEPGRILHVGDNLYTDILAAAQRGLAVRPVLLGPVRPRALLEGPSQISDAEDPAFSLGYRTLGPIFVTFSRLLFRQASRDGVQQLAFVARDGDLLLRVAQTLVEKGKNAGGLALRYVHLSRRAAACCSPDLRTLQSDPEAAEQVIAALRSIRGHGTLMESFQSYYNLPSEVISRHKQRLHLQNGDETDVRQLFSDNFAIKELEDAFAPMRDRLRRYLIQENVLSGRTALVDIGWRGSLQKIIESESKLLGLPAPRGYYLGLWDEGSRTFAANSSGLICDQRRGRSLYEGSAWHTAFLLEALCRARHGIVAGFNEDADGSIQPVHVETGKTREAERESEYTQSRVQNGVLAYARWFAESYAIAATDESAIRREAQRLLYKLAFFPSREEREIGRSLVHSEPTSDNSAMWLIADPGVGFRGWLLGLRSPWKAGYIRATGGRVAAVIYSGVEGLLAQLPPGTKPAIRRLLAAVNIISSVH